MLQEIIQKIPGVESPTQRQTFKDKLKWTGIILILYYIMSQIIVYGIDESLVIRFEQLEILMGASMGSLITLGIGPIVSASIILQLLVGAKIIGWDLSTQQGKILFQGTQKLLAIAFAIVEAIGYTLMGAIKPMSSDPFLVSFVILQLALGGIVIILMDEVVSKWGFGSGVGLFIVAGVSKNIVIRAFSPVKTIAGAYAGIIPQLLSEITQGSPSFNLLLPLISTLLVFLIVVYAQAMRVEIPLAFGSIRGFGRRWPLKFIYTSNMPVILTAAVLINLQIWAKLLASKGITILGTFEGNTPISGLVYYLSRSSSPQIQMFSIIAALFVIAGLIVAYTLFKENKFQIMSGSIIIGLIASTYLTKTYYGLPTSIDVLRALIYTLFMICGATIFSIFWVNTSGMDAKNVAQQIQRSGMQIPGFRRDVRIIERVLERYVVYLAVLGGIFVGFLAAFADFTGALAGGTGILLAVMIVYQLYEQIAMQHTEDMHPALRKLIGK